MSGMPVAPSRRSLLAAGISLTLFPLEAAAAGKKLRIALLGQSLIKTDLRQFGWHGEAEFRRLLRRNHAVFTDLETVIGGPLAGQPTRPPESDTLHVGDAAVIDCLHGIGVNLFATANNHAWDLGTGGILSTMDALRSRSLTFAGTGHNLNEASAPGLLAGRAQVALVAAAAGAIREGAAATDTRAGVNELRRDGGGDLVAVDVERYLAAIRFAATHGATVIAYLHNHYWEARKSDVPAWQRDLARRAIDAGAATFVAHGVPELQGIEFYRGAPLFHGLSSFIFQTVKADDAYGPEAWQSVIAELELVGGRVASVALVPVQLDARGVAHEGRRVPGSPRLASGSSAQAIVERLTGLSEALGSSITIERLNAAAAAAAPVRVSAIANIH